MFKSLVESLGGKKISTTFAGMFSVILTMAFKIIGAKVGVEISQGEVETFAMLLAGLATAGVGSIMAVDLKTNGQTTTAAQIARTGVANPPANPTPAQPLQPQD